MEKLNWLLELGIQQFGEQLIERLCELLGLLWSVFSQLFNDGGDVRDFDLRDPNQVLHVDIDNGSILLVQGQQNRGVLVVVQHDAPIVVFEVLLDLGFEAPLK